MNSNRKKTITGGVLYIIGTIAGILSIAPSIDASDYLVKASVNTDFKRWWLAILYFIVSIKTHSSLAITLGSCRYDTYHICQSSDHVSCHRYYHDNLHSFKPSANCT
jgi:hypothetical protein